jgi:hypothetical protein
MAQCRNHPNVPATGRCTGCAEEFCSNCLVDVRGQQYCSACKVMALEGKVPGAAMAAQERGQLPNKAAKEVLILSIVSIFCCGIILGPIAIFKAVQARAELNRDPQLGGSGMVTAALVIAIISTILNILGLALRVSTMR